MFSLGFETFILLLLLNLTLLSSAVSLLLDHQTCPLTRRDSSVIATPPPILGTVSTPFAPQMTPFSPTQTDPMEIITVDQLLQTLLQLTSSYRTVPKLWCWQEEPKHGQPQKRQLSGAAEVQGKLVWWQKLPVEAAVRHRRTAHLLLMTTWIRHLCVRQWRMFLLESLTRTLQEVTMKPVTQRQSRQEDHHRHGLPVKFYHWTRGVMTWGQLILRTQQRHQKGCLQDRK